MASLSEVTCDKRGAEGKKKVFVLRDGDQRDGDHEGARKVAEQFIYVRIYRITKVTVTVTVREQKDHRRISE